MIGFGLPLLPPALMPGVHRRFADILFSLADGFALRMLSEPERDFSQTMLVGIECARGLLSD